MFRFQWKYACGVLVFGSAVVLGSWLLSQPRLTMARAQEKPGKSAMAPSDDSLGYSTVFKAELQKIGQISPEEFARRYPAPANYGGKFSWDPTTAKFWPEFNCDPGQLPAPKGAKHGRFDFRLNDKELAQFKENGFVVSERLSGESFAELFYRIYSRDLPVYVSSDAMLHAWHRTYDSMLEELEETYLAASLDEILAGMAENIPAAKKQYGAGVLADSLADADYFLAVARSLRNGGPVATKLNQEARVAETLRAVDKMQMQKFVLFGREREMDFSQFKVRGHYENSDQLKKYFKAMMWCGRTDMRIAGGKDYFGELSSTQELGSAIVLHDLLRSAGKFEQWQRFDRMIQTFVGRTDSATFAHMDALMKKAGIKTPADVKDQDHLKTLQADILAGKIGLQEICGDIYTSPFGANQQVELPRSFTVLGQKFVLDSWVTSKVVFDDVLWNDKKVERFVPSCLDVAFAAMGNNQVTPLLVDRMTAGTHPRRDKMKYQHNLAAARNTIDAQQPAAWDENLYMGWLGSLRELSQPTTDAKYPEVMRSRAWAMKSLNTQLASWTQLRHDTILYAKQSYSIRTLCYYPAGFVEPVPHFWTRLEAMVQRAAEHIGKTPYPESAVMTQKKQVAFLQNFAKQVGIVKTIAVKQLEQKELSKEETIFLEDIVQLRFGSGGPTYNGWYPGLFYKGRTDSGKWDALVADVHTDPDLDQGCVLHQGVGNVDLMLIAIDNGKDRMIYAGPVLSHYEFEMKGAVRKADSEWRKDINEGKLPPRPEWTRGYLVPGVNPAAKNFRQGDGD